jgi:dipeptidase D
MSDHAAIKALAPQPVWKNFTALNAIPRASKKEERVIAFMKDFGERLSLDTIVDKAGNVIIRKPASEGYENRPGIILQAHLDMVHQKNADTSFDFDTQGIEMYIDEDWVKAKGTTLGADNGIGVACIMSILESTDIPHPPIEALFTIDEETGMTGAKGLEEGLLKSKIMLNLDCEEDDTIAIGCAGGIDSNTYLIYTQETPPPNSQAFEIKIRGLKGGHSGVDIHLGRANANILMNRLLYKSSARVGTINGGSLRNAIPRESTAVVAVAESQVGAFTRLFEERRQMLLNENRIIEPDLSISLSDADMPDLVMEEEIQEKVLNSIYAVPNGVWRMSPAVPGLVETSSSLARVIVEDGEFITQSLQRSSVESGKNDIANAVRAAFENVGVRVDNDGDYPGWEPNPDSPTLKQLQTIYERLFNETPKAVAFHAGVECGIIGNHYPGLDMLSIGPTILHPHSPDEKVSIPSVQKFWRYFLAVLAEIQ